MKLKEVLNGIEIIKTNITSEPEIKGITENTKKIKEGFIFTAIKGARFDANTFIKAALEMKAVCIVTETEPEDEVPYVLVKDARKTLSLMLCNFYSRPHESFKICVGITGTNGKTSTSVMIKKILEEGGMKVGLIGTMKYLIGEEEFNSETNSNHLTTPDSENFWSLLALMRDKGVDALVMEVSSHSLELNKISGMHFNAGVFTNLTRDHLDFHKDFENYKRAKAKLFEMCDIAIINDDDAYGEDMKMLSACPVKTYSIDRNSSDFTAKNTKLKGADGVEYELLSEEMLFRVKVNIPGTFTVYNSLAAASLALTVGVGCDKIIKGLLSTQRIEGRIDKIDIDAPFSVIIDFAHTPDAMQNVLTTVRDFAPKRIITLFGCGGDRDKTKRSIMGKIATEMSEYVIITSDNSRSEDKMSILGDIVSGIDEKKKNYELIPDRKEAIMRAMDIAESQDIVMLLGKGHEEYEIDADGKHPFSERKIVTDYFNER